MRIIQVIEDERNNQQYSHDIDRQLRNSLVYVSHRDPPLVDSGMQLHLRR